MTLSNLCLHTNAFTQVLGVLYQCVGKDKQVLFNSHTLLPGETRYTFTELEALAILWGINHNRHYLFGCPFHVVTDHHARLASCILMLTPL